MHFEVFGGLAGAELVSDDLSHHVKPWCEGFHKMAFSFYVVLLLCFLIAKDIRSHLLTKLFRPK